MTLAARFCDRVAVLRAGRLIALGAPTAVLTPEQLATTFRVRCRHDAYNGASLITPWDVV